MSRKSIVMLGMVVGSLIGSYVPSFFGVGIFSYTSLFFNALGSILGLIIAYKLTQGF